MNKIIMFKIGHDETNVMHARGGGIFYPWVNNSRIGSDCYNPENQWLSEFSSIEEILYNINDRVQGNASKLKYDADYVGVCHYRCLIGDLNPEDSYENNLKTSTQIIMDGLNSHPGGIISTTYNKMNLENWQQGPRWTGTKSIDYLIRVLREDKELLEVFFRYLHGFENSFKTVCCLPRNEFIRIFNTIVAYSQDLIQLRRENGDLTPRSVGYELETLTSALLIDYWSNHSDSVARIKHTVL